MSKRWMGRILSIEEDERHVRLGIEVASGNTDDLRPGGYPWTDLPEPWAEALDAMYRGSDEQIEAEEAEERAGLTAEETERMTEAAHDLFAVMVDIALERALAARDQKPEE